MYRIIKRDDYYFGAWYVLQEYCTFLWWSWWVDVDKSIFYSTIEGKKEFLESEHKDVVLE